MFGRNPIAENPLSIQPKDFDFGLLVGFKVFISNRVVGSLPDLLMIPWASSGGVQLIATADDLVDINDLGDAPTVVSIQNPSDLAPSWYIREPKVSLWRSPWAQQDRFGLHLALPHEAPPKKEEEKTLGFDVIRQVGVSLIGPWDTIPIVDLCGPTLPWGRLGALEHSPNLLYSHPEKKEDFLTLPWDAMGSWPEALVHQPWSNPPPKEVLKHVLWDGSITPFEPLWDLRFRYPPEKDVFWEVGSGRRWYPQWCTKKYVAPLGTEIVFQLRGGTAGYPQNLAIVRYPKAIIPLEPAYPQPAVLPVTQRELPQVSRHLFGRLPLSIHPKEPGFQAHGRVRAKMSNPILEEPVLYSATSQGGEVECFDGTWNGPKDAYWYQPHEWEFPQPQQRRYFIVPNTVTMVRAADGIPIPIETLEVSSDLDSWCWNLRATVKTAADLALVQPSGGAPVEVLAAINGSQWRFLVEEWGSDRQFGQWGYSLTGRSPSALLAAPYALPGDRAETSQLSAAQIAGGELDGTGYALGWQLPDWLVPAGAYSLQGKTVIEALGHIAAAAGGAIQSDPETATVSLLPWYPHLPWTWGAVAVDAVVPTWQARRTAYRPSPQYSGVYVSGVNQGVTCLVKRTGTDGSSQPAMQTHPLITATAPGLALGSKILADSGPRAIETLSLPLLPDPGLLLPGKLVEVVDAAGNWRGLVTGCAIAAKRPAVTQTLAILRYLGS